MTKINLLWAAIWQWNVEPLCREQKAGKRLKTALYRLCKLRAIQYMTTWYSDVAKFEVMLYNGVTFRNDKALIEYVNSLGGYNEVYH